MTAHAQQCGVRNGYQRVQSLGSDVGQRRHPAWQHTQSPACLVINCGNATTVDALSPKANLSEA